MSSTGRGAKRRANDDYQTPPWVLKALLPHVQVRGRVLEPCRGSGNLIGVLANQPAVTCVDWCEITEGRDFLNIDPRAAYDYDWIVTNPPYSLAREFVEKSLGTTPNVAMLLRLNFLGSDGRREWWLGREPDALYVVTPRPHFLDRFGYRVVGKDGTPGNDSCEYGWFVWGPHYSGIHVIGGGKT